MRKYFFYAYLRILGFAFLLAPLAALVSACAGTEISAAESELSPSAVITVPSPQETVYNGSPQPLKYHYGGEEKPRVVYYPSAAARAGDRDGSVSPPVQAGVYYARVKYPAGKDAPAGEDVFAEYRIFKRPVKIEAEAAQKAFYNGNPKRVEARTEYSLPLSYSYYPNRELMDTAVRAAREAAPAGSPVRPLSESYRGYRRVDRAPTEQGTYHVWVYFPGDENHESAETFVEFIILPPRG